MIVHKKILIVEDDEAIAAGLSLNLKISGYAPTVATDGEKALACVSAGDVDLILLDINLPVMNGLEFMTELRRTGDRTPIIMLSARSDEYDKVAALRLGADDYVTKPFSLAELLARVDAVLRRASAVATTAAVAAVAADAPDEQLEFADVVIDPDMRTVSRCGEEVRLTRLEFELLCFLVKNPSRVFARDELLRGVWGQKSGSQRTIDNFVAQLRSKLEVDPENPQHFVTVRGAGYRFDP